MIAFRVFHNDSEVCLAGVEGLGVLTAIVTWANRSGERTESDEPEESLKLLIGALRTSTDEDFTWSPQRLSVGDSVTIRIEEADRVNEPCTREVWPKETLESKKIRTRDLAAELGWTLIESDPNPSTP